MYLNNKYNRYYYNIINNSLSRTLDTVQYYERHHIIPKSLKGTNQPSNIAILTAREHFVCHLLLTRMTTGSDRHKMVHALWCMVNKKNSRRYTPTSRLYESAKKQRSEILKSRRGKNHPNYGKKHPERTSDTFTDEWRANISKSKQGVVPAAVPKGSTRGAEFSNTLSARKKELFTLNKDNPNYNKRPPCKAETANKIKEANTGRKWINDGKGNRVYANSDELVMLLNQGWCLGMGKTNRNIQLECPHCGKKCDRTNYTRWHGDKCKIKD